MPAGGLETDIGRDERRGNLWLPGRVPAGGLETLSSGMGTVHVCGRLNGPGSRLELKLARAATTHRERQATTSTACSMLTRRKHAQL